MEQLGIDLKQLVAQMINFALFFVIFKKFVAVPFARFIEEERLKEKEKEEILAKLKIEEDKLEEGKARIKDESEKERDKILKQTQKEAEELRQRIIGEAKKEAEEVKYRVKKQLEEEKEKLNKAAKERMVDLSIAIIDKAFKDFLDDETKKKITKHILNNVGKKVVYYEN